MAHVPSQFRNDQLAHFVQLRRRDKPDERFEYLAPHVRAPQRRRCQLTQPVRERSLQHALELGLAVAAGGDRGEGLRHKRDRTAGDVQHPVRTEISEIIIATKMISAKLFVRVYGRPWLREPSTSCSRREAMALCCGAFSAGQWCRSSLHPPTHHTLA